MIFQIRFGFPIEDYYGLKRYIAIYLVGGFGGNLLSAAINTETVMMGASSSGYGLLAVLGCYYAYNWHTFGIGRNFNLKVYLGVVAFGTIFTLITPNNDKLGHLGGFISGGLIGMALIPRVEDTVKWKAVVFGSAIALLMNFIIFSYVLANVEFKCAELFGNDYCAFCDGPSLIH